MQARPEVADWAGLEVPAAEPDVPEELVEREVEALRASVAELVPVEDRPAKDGDVLVVDLLDETGEAQRDYVVQLGSGRLIEELERGLRGMTPGETKKIGYSDPEGKQKEAEATLKEIKEPVLPPPPKAVGPAPTQPLEPAAPPPQAKPASQQSHAKPAPPQPPAKPADGPARGDDGGDG